MIKIFCDFCNQEIHNDSYATLILDTSKQTERKISSYALCTLCQLEIEQKILQSQCKD